MNRLCLATVPILFLALASSPTAAQPEPGLDLSAAEAAEVLDAMAPTNAALVYYQLFLYEDPQLVSARHFFEGEEIDQSLVTRMGMTLEEAEQLLIDAQERIENYIWAASLPGCDFGLQYQDGWTMLLPHLGKLREACRLLSADAYRLMEEGEFNKAEDRFIAIYNIGQQIKNDRTLISSLVGMALTALATDGVQHMLELGQLTEQGRDRFIATLEGLDTDDPFDLLDCFVMESTLSLGWVAKEFADGAEGNMLNEWFEWAADDKTLLARLDAMDGPALLQEAERMSEYYTQGLAFWDDPDAIDKLEALGAIVEIGGYGDLGRLLLGSMSKTKAQDIRIKAKIDDTLDTLYAYRPTTSTGDDDPEDAEAKTPAVPAATDPSPQR